MLHKIGVLKNLLNSLENCARVRRSLACNFTKNVNVQRAQFKSVQVRTAGGRVMLFEYIRSLALFLLFFFFFSLWSMQILQTLRVKICTNRFQELYCCCIHLQLFITLHQSNFELWESLNFIQPQAMAMLALNFRIGVQFRNKVTLWKVNIALQTILSLRLCIAPEQD